MDLYDPYNLYYLAHVAGWVLDDLHYWMTCTTMQIMHKPITTAADELDDLSVDR